jgi:hypothetical protein
LKSIEQEADAPKGPNRILLLASNVFFPKRPTETPPASPPLLPEDRIYLRQNLPMGERRGPRSSREEAEARGDPVQTRPLWARGVRTPNQTKAPLLVKSVVGRLEVTDHRQGLSAGAR